MSHKDHKDHKTFPQVNQKGTGSLRWWLTRSKDTAPYHTRVQCGFLGSMEDADKGEDETLGTRMEVSSESE